MIRGEPPRSACRAIVVDTRPPTVRGMNRTDTDEHPAFSTQSACRQTKTRKFVGLAAATTLVSTAGWGLASGIAEARVGPVPDYHWCPGDNDQDVCHDDHHRDLDGNDHS